MKVLIEKDRMMCFSETNRKLRIGYIALFTTTVIGIFIKSTWPAFKYLKDLRIKTTKQQNSSFEGSWRFVGHNFSSTIINKSIGSLTRNSKTDRENVSIDGEVSCNDDFKRRHLMAVNQICRTGNRLFQFAVLIATAEEVCYTAIRTPKFIPHIDHIFDIKNVVKMDYDPQAFRNIRPSGGLGFFNSSFISHINPKYNWTIRGYVQSFKYFHKHSQLVRSSFIFKDDIKKDVFQYLKSFQSTIKVCPHIRRGDFVHPVYRAMGFVASNIGFINRAIDHFNKTLKDKFVLIVVSDDIPWCKKNIKGNNVHFSPFKDGGQDLFLLTQCDHNIVSSGTFGWMGAWLNQTGMVIYDKSYPRRGSKLANGYRESDYHPSDWIGL